LSTGNISENGKISKGNYGGQNAFKSGPGRALGKWGKPELQRSYVRQVAKDINSLATPDSIFATVGTK
jgi:hypothetical protein